MKLGYILFLDEMPNLEIYNFFIANNITCRSEARINGRLGLAYKIQIDPARMLGTSNLSHLNEILIHNARAFLKG